MKVLNYCLFLALFIFTLLYISCEKSPVEKANQLEQRLEQWRIRLKMPAFSAAVIKGGEIIWAKGFGYADLENKIPATENTVYHLASLTKPYTAIILMQLVEQGIVNLEDPLIKYDINLDQARQYGMELTDEKTIKVKHILTHTAQGEPGSYYLYSGYLFGFITDIIEKSSGKSLAELVVNNITHPLNLSKTIPNIQDSIAFSFTGYDKNTFAADVAVPYVMDSLYNIIPSDMETYFGASAGLMSSAIDMANFSKAIDDRKLLKPETWDQVFMPTISNDGKKLPYGYGWFVQTYQGIKIQWHYGFWNTNSSLIMRVPEKNLTFVILANTNLLSRPFGLGGADGDVFHSPFALEFARLFLFDEKIPPIDFSIPEEQLKEKMSQTRNSAYADLVVHELFAFAAAFNVTGEQKNAEKVYQLYSDLFTKPLPDKLNSSKLITEITQVGDDVTSSQSFVLNEQTDLSIFAIGEGSGSEMYDYGWIENIISGDTLWIMDINATKHAGGSDKNRLIDTTLTLPAGQYKLGYTSDDSHSFSRWNATPPDYAFYGIAIYSNSERADNKVKTK